MLLSTPISREITLNRLSTFRNLSLDVLIVTMVNHETKRVADGDSLIQT